MATIRTAIALYDGVTAPLKSMHKAMNIVLNSFEAMQRASGNSVDTSAIREACEELARAGAAFDSIEENIRDAGNQQDRFNRRIRDGTTAADGLWGKLKGIAATVGGLAAAKKIIGISDDLASTRARLNLIVDDGGSVSELEKKIMASAQRSRSAYFDTASAIASLGANAGAAFANTDEIIAFMEQINKQFVIGGASAQGQAAAMLQLTQAMAAGALRGEELNSILENAPGIARAIESYMGIAEGSIKSYAEQGLITAEVVKNAMFAAADETNAKFESMPKTWAQIWTSMQNKALSIFNPILTKINQIANSEQFTKVTDGIINGLAGIASVATVVLDLLINVASVVVDNWSWLSPIILGVAAALGVYYGRLLLVRGAELASAAVSGAVAVAKGIMAAATMLVTGATWAQVTAQYGLNAAMYACPLVWIIILIIALVPSAIDNWIKCQAGVHCFGHYMDDYYLIFPDVEALKKLGHEVVRRFEALGIRVNKRKCKIIPLTKPFRFCKARFTLTETGKIKVNGNRDGVKRARRKLKLFHREFLEGKRLLSEVEQFMECQTAYYRNFNDHGRLLRLRRLYHAIFFGGAKCIGSSKTGPTLA